MFASGDGGRLASEGRRKGRASLLLHLPHLVRVLVSPHPPVSFRAPLEQPQAARGGVLAPLHVGLQALQAAWCSTAPAVALSCWSASTKACSRRRYSAASCVACL